MIGMMSSGSSLVLVFDAGGETATVSCVGASAGAALASCVLEEVCVLRRGVTGRDDGGVAVMMGEPRGVEGAVCEDRRGDASSPSRGEVAGDDHPDASSSHTGSSPSPDLRWNHLLCFAKLRSVDTPGTR